jgi:cytochrome c oxidase subunit 1
VMGFLGGLFYWWPKMCGKLYNEAQAKVSWALVFVGFNITFMSQFIMGSRGMPRRYYDYLPEFEPFHKASTIGSWILASGLFFTGYILLTALIKGPKAPPNPWGSAGLEWQTESPPVLSNFAKTPIVTRGPYDYHLATAAELFDGFPEEKAKMSARELEEQPLKSGPHKDDAAAAKKNKNKVEE